MKTKNLSVAIVVLVLVFVGGIFLWNKWQPKNATEIVNNEMTPEQTLINFFDSLVNKDYESAVKIFYPVDANGDYNWNMVTQYRDPNKQNATKSEELAYYCEAVGTCLKIEVLSSAGINKDIYAFKAQFRDQDNNIFLYGPFGGMTAEQSPPETKFQYYVKKIDGVYKVITPPLYRP